MRRGAVIHRKKYSSNNGVVSVAAGPNKVLTFAGEPVVYELEWNQIPIARREQPYVSAIAGIIHGSSHLAFLFLGWSIPETLGTRASWNQMTPQQTALCHSFWKLETMETVLEKSFFYFFFIYLTLGLCKSQTTYTRAQLLM